MREGWKRTTLKEVSSKIGDGLHGTPKYDEQGEYFFVNGNNLESGKVKIKPDTKRLSQEEYDRIKKKLTDRTILVSINGTLGNIGLYNGENLALGKSACYINVLPGVSKLFIRYILEYEHFQKYAYLFATGSTIKNLGLKAIRNYKFHLPPLPTQRKIAAILSAYDDLIENNLQRIKLLEEQAQLTYEEWFVRLKFPGYETTPVDEETGLPVGWERKELGDYLVLNYGKALKADSRIEGEFNVYGSSGVVGTHNEALVEGPGIIVGRKGNVGSVFWEEGGFYPIDTVYYVSSDVSLYYIYYDLKGQNFINNDAAVPGLNRNSAYLKSSLLPSEEVLARFDATIKKSFDCIQVLKAQNQLLKEARDLLLPRLMTGMIDVEELEVPE